MNKKLLFGLMSLAALAACTNDDFETQGVAEQASPIQFEVINNDATMRASMDGNKISWSATDGDLFTLYHGGAGITGYENATYKATASDGAPATLTTPSMIKQGLAVMVWPVDTTFRINADDNLSIEIPADQKKDIENYIPYMSDQVTIAAYADYDAAPANAYNKAGKDRQYPVFMRPMASQLTIKADYGETYQTIQDLVESDGIKPIKLTSVELLTRNGGATEFTTNLDVKWTAASATITAQWADVENNAWTAVTDFDLTAINAHSDILTTECLTGNESCKFLILPQADIATGGGVLDGAMVVNTIYGKVVIGDPTVYAAAPNKSYYTAEEYGKAWYRYISQASKNAGVTAHGALNGYDEDETVAATAGSDGKYKTTSSIANGLKQTINVFSTYKHQSDGVVKGEPEGVSATRYVNVNLSYLDMSGLHIEDDEQLHDVAVVWDALDIPDVTVYLDGDANGEFEISQATIAKINTINATAAAAGKSFKVKPCNTAGEVCTEIVIKDGGVVPNLGFIVQGDAPNTADVVLKAGQTWSWTATDVTIATVDKKAIKVGTGVKSIINEGTFEASTTTATIATCNAAAAAWTNVPFENAKGATWNVNAGDLTVQFDVTNYGTVKIASGAEYHQDIALGAATTFTNEAEDLPTRFGGDDAEIGKVENKGVFAVTGTTATKGIINNYGLIEHADNAAKTYITTNELAGTTFATPFSAVAPLKKIGRINLPYSNKDEDNISVSSALNSGFVSVTVTSSDAPATKKLNLTAVGDKVNYVIIKGGIDTVTEMTNAIEYIEFDDENDTEIAWQAGTSATPVTATYEGLIVLSPVNIKLYTNVIVNQATYLGAKMYVGGTFTNGAAVWAGYYGDTTANESSKYITY